MLVYTYDKVNLLRNVGKGEYFIWIMITVQEENGPFIIVLISDYNS